MKKLNILAFILVMGIAFVSCDKGDVNDPDATLKKAVAEGISAPVSFEGVTPYIIPGENPGGNRTCAEVAAWAYDEFGWTDGFDFCGEKVDYGYFETGFPAALNVTSDGKTLAFDAESCIMIGDKYYMVGAVIVKGSNAANVYFYEDGILSDSNLSAPVNASGKPAAISNVTFCFIECEDQPDLVIAFKGYVAGGPWACTATETIGFVAPYDFKPGYVVDVFSKLEGSYPIVADLTKPVGTITVDDIDDDGLWEVIVEYTATPVMGFNDGYLFVGTFEDYDGLVYTDFEYKTGIVTPTSTMIFDLPF